MSRLSGAAVNGERYWAKAKVWAVGICCLAFALLVCRLGEKSLWGDEARTAQIVQDGFGLVIGALEQGHPHPPLYFLCLWAWSKAAGGSEFALRFPSVVFGVLSMAVLYSVAWRMMGSRVGLLAMGLMALSSAAVLYIRMARYYSLVLLLSLLSYWFFLRLWNGPRTADKWTGYIICSTLALYTFYPTAFVLAGQSVVALANAVRSRRFVLLLLGSQSLVLILFSPWIRVAIHQMNVLGATADAFWGSSLALWLLSAAYPFFAWIVGGSLYPWNPLALIGFLVGIALAVAGLISAADPSDADPLIGLHTQEPAGPGVRKEDSWVRRLCFLLSPQVLALPVFILLPLLLTVVAMRRFITGDPLVANRTIFCMPFLYILIARGIAAINRPVRRALLLAILGVALVVSLANYYTGREFHNPNFVLPTRESASMIGKQSRPTDVFVSDYMTAFNYYISEESPDCAHFLADESQAARSHIGDRQSPRVWLVLLCRAVETESLATAELVPWLLDQGYSLELAFGYAPMDDVYARLQGIILNKPSCEYKVMVYRYARL